MTEPRQETDAVAREMPFPMRIVVSIVLMLLSLWFTLVILDVVSSEAAIAAGKAETVAEIIGKNSTRGRGGYRYFVEYAFESDGAAYSRKFLFRLFDKKSEVHRSEYESLEVGAGVPVVYARGNPDYNRPRDDRNVYANFLWYVLGIAGFGAIAINEAKIIFRKIRK